MSKALVKCETSEGMFSNECAVTLESGGGKLSLFADKDLIQKRNGDYYLVVNLAGAGGAPGFTRILLPSESFEKGTRWVEVPTASVANI
jgi:hypothetical protein